MIRHGDDHIFDFREPFPPELTHLIQLNTNCTAQRFTKKTETMETDERLPTGEWAGFYLEAHRAERGWMHLYLSFEGGQIKGEGTDYVGPWVATGTYDLDSGQCHWTKQYLGKHQVIYSGQCGQAGIQGHWEISFLSGPFHIWPKGMSQLDELYLRSEIDGVPMGATDRSVSATELISANG